MTERLSRVVLGATGAVGRQVVRAALASERVARVTTLGRRPVDLPGSPAGKPVQQVVDVFDASAFEPLLRGHDDAVCTLGVGEPSKVSSEELRRVDVEAPVAFAEACRRQGLRHFTLQTAVGANAKSSVEYLRLKGELEARVTALAFERTSFFRPSMLLISTNRHGTSQALLLALWPRLHRLLAGFLRKYRGIRVEALGRAMAANVLRPAAGAVELLQWNGFHRLLSGEIR